VVKPKDKYKLRNGKVAEIDHVTESYVYGHVGKDVVVWDKKMLSTIAPFSQELDMVSAVEEPDSYAIGNT